MCGVGHPRAPLAVAAHPPQALPRSAGVHPEDEFLVVLVDLKAPGVGPTPLQECARQVAARALAISRRSEPAIVSTGPFQPRSRLQVQASLDPLVAELLLDEGDQAGHPVDEEVVDELRLVLHRLAETLRLLDVAPVESPRSSGPSSVATSPAAPLRRTISLPYLLLHPRTSVIRPYPQIDSCRCAVASWTYSHPEMER